MKAHGSMTPRTGKTDKNAPLSLAPTSHHRGAFRLQGTVLGHGMMALDTQASGAKTSITAMASTSSVAGECMKAIITTASAHLAADIGTL